MAPSYSAFGPVLGQVSRALSASRRRQPRGIASSAGQGDWRAPTASPHTAEVLEIGIRGEADTTLFSLASLHLEGRIARHFVCELIELDVRRRELLAVDRGDDDVAKA